MNTHATYLCAHSNGPTGHSTQLWPDRAGPADLHSGHDARMGWATRVALAAWAQEWSAIQKAATSSDAADGGGAALPSFVAIVLSCIVGTGISYFGLLAR